jgi:exodeoxyribonuclease V beta subunit
MATLKTLLDTRRAKSDGCYNIIFRITHNRNNYSINSGVAVLAHQWNDKKSEINPPAKHLIHVWKQTLNENRIIDPDSLIKLIEVFQPDRLKKKHGPKAAQLASWMEEKKEVQNILGEFSIKKRGLERLAKRLKKSLAPLFKKDFRLGYDVILKKLEECLDSPMGPSLAHSLKLLIVDEFQDTDPVQWRLFQKIAKLNPSLQLILVGDPKQSIYSFRQADIYTYMAAKTYVRDQLKGSVDQLKTNYRSHPLLVNALNHLFADSSAGKWLKLPRIDGFLECPEVIAGRIDPVDKQEPRLFFHDLDSHETEDYFINASIWIDCEVRRLRLLGCQKMAILVSSNKTSRDMQDLLQGRGHKCSIQRPEPLAHLKAFELFRLMLEAFEKPFLDGRMKRLWSHPIWGLSLDELEGILGVNSASDLNYQSPYALFWQKITGLHSKLKEKGVGAFWQAFWQLECFGQTFYERLHLFSKGAEIYDQMQCLWFWLEEKEPHLFALEALKKMDALERGYFEEEAVYHPQTDEESIDILTVHSSKGLEYEVVFCLSNLPSKGHQKEHWMSIYKEEGAALAFGLEDEHPDYLKACDELDAEKARRLYVAWTRAREYLLVGYSSKKRTKVPSRSQATSLELFQASWQRPESATIGQWYEAMASDESSLWYEALKQLEKQKIVALTTASSLHLLEMRCLGSLAQTLSLDIEPSVSYKSSSKSSRDLKALIWQRSSFSSLHRMAQDLGYSQDLAYSCFQEEFSSTENEIAKVSEVEDVPRGTEVGTLWHLMFQRSIQLLQQGVCTSEIFSYLISPLFLKKLPHFQDYEPWIEAMSCQVVKLLDTPFLFEENERVISFSLANLKPGSIWTEKNFELERQRVTQKLGSFIEIGRDPIQLSGVIDVLVRLPEGFVFIDWKSNWLGEGAVYQKSKALQNAKEHRYDLQALIYQTAIEESLLITEKQPLLGGLYVYLRGPVSLTWSAKKRAFEEKF